MSLLFHQPIEQDEEALRDPALVLQKLNWLQGQAAGLAETISAKEARLAELKATLDLAPKVEAALETLSQEMFLKLVSTLEENLSRALQEVLDQPLLLKAETSFDRRVGVKVDFHIERSGEREDIMRGQGGSVANVLSVGLRMFALATLDPAKHRPFLVLDEPDGWLRPELVPTLVRIIRNAGRELGFQVLLISHHDLEGIRDLADRIYTFHPQPDGSVKVREDGPAPKSPDDAEALDPEPAASLFDLR